MARQTKRLFIFIIYFICAFSASSQVSELHLLELSNCTPEKNKGEINTVELAYKDGASLYNDAINDNLVDSSKIKKLVSLLKIQVSAKNQLQEIWQQSDSVPLENSRKYFEEANRAFKEISDTLNLVNPEFKTLSRALIIVEKFHQIILLQKFGIQVLFGCIKETTTHLSQPTDISNDIVINIDMIERFRKVWNEDNFPMTYERWEYKPSERKTFSNKYYADSWANRQFIKKDDVNLTEESKNSYVSTFGNQQDLSLTKNQSNIIGGDNFKDTKDRNISSESGNHKNSQTYSIKGERKKFNVSNNNTQFEVRSLIAQSKIKKLGVEYFSIQIAASKSQLLMDKLKAEFNCGNFDIEERSESGWFKYLVGHFASIDSANSFLSKPCMVRGFVSGYNSKGRIAIFSIKQSIINAGYNSTYSIVYRVQVAASKDPLSTELLSKVYNGINPINISQEDGWYRYSIGDFMYYDEAKTVRDSSGVKNAFIMPYQNGKRIQWPAKEALESLKVWQKEKPIYVIQIVASRKPLSLDLIKNIIRIDHPLTMKHEDGWYKYFISAFTDISSAKKVAEKLGIKGAFIATYKNGLRVNP